MPIACSMALAMEPWLNEPISRRLPFIFKYRAAHAVGVPTSQVKTASSAATSLTRRGDVLGVNDVAARAASRLGRRGRGARTCTRLMRRIQVAGVNTLGQLGQQSLKGSP